MIICTCLGVNWNQNSGLQVSTTDAFDLYVTIIRYIILITLYLNNFMKYLSRFVF